MSDLPHVLAATLLNAGWSISEVMGEVRFHYSRPMISADIFELQVVAACHNERKRSEHEKRSKKI